MKWLGNQNKKIGKIIDFSGSLTVLKKIRSVKEKYLTAAPFSDTITQVVVKYFTLQEEKTMDEILHLTLLYDFYGELLTEKQKQVFDLHYQDDLSLSEIGEELSISRQAVRDQLKRTEKILMDYEQKLGLVARFQAQKKSVREMLDILQEMETDGLSEKRIHQLEKMKQIAEAILS